MPTERQPTVRFVLGRAGSGKTTRLHEVALSLLREDPLGPPIFLVVPKQATFERERFFAVACDLPAVSRLRVTSFDGLCDLILAECGGTGVGDVTAAGRRLLLGHVLRGTADSLGFFRRAARHAGTIGEIDRTLAEIARAGHAPSDLVGDDADDGESAALSAKLRDLALIGDAYGKLLGGRLDAPTRLARVLECAPRCRLFDGATLLVDDHDEIVGFDRRLLGELAPICSTSIISLPLDPASAGREDMEELGHMFGGVARSYRRLRETLELGRARVLPPEPLENRPRFATSAVSFVERDFDQPRPGRAADPAGAVRLVEAADPRAEAEAAARQVLDWTLDGRRLAECCVLCRDADDHAPLLSAAFEEHGLAYFLDRRRPARHHPLVRFLRAALRCAEQGWPPDAAMELAKCGLSRLSAGQADLLENFVLDNRVRGRRAWTGREPWRGRGQSRDADDGDVEAQAAHEAAEVADDLRRRLAEGLAPLSAAFAGVDRTTRDYAAALWETVEAFAVADGVAAMIDGADDAAAAEHRQAWAAVCDLLDQAVDLLGGETTSARHFAQAMDDALDALDFAVAPPTADAVLLGDAERTVTLGRTCCVVIGLNEGVFPRAAEPNVVLGDDERRQLTARGVEVAPGGPRRQARERWLGYRALTRAGDRVTLVCAAADAAGRPLAPSPYFDRVRRLLGLDVEVVARHTTRPPSVRRGRRSSPPSAGPETAATRPTRRPPYILDFAHMTTARSPACATRRGPRCRT